MPNIVFDIYFITNNSKQVKEYYLHICTVQLLYHDHISISSLIAEAYIAGRFE